MEPGTARNALEGIVEGTPEPDRFAHERGRGHRPGGDSGHDQGGEAEMQAQASRANDDMIEKADLSDMDTPDDEAMTRGMMYYVRHGGFKGTD